MYTKSNDTSENSITKQQQSKFYFEQNNQLNNINIMYQTKQESNLNINPNYKNYKNLDRTSTDYYTNLTNNHVNSYLNNLDHHHYQQYSFNQTSTNKNSSSNFNQTSSSFNQTSSNQTSINQNSSSFKTSSSSLSSTSSLNSKKLFFQENLNSNLANFVSESQIATNKNLPFQQVKCSLVWSNVSYKVNDSEFKFNIKKPFNFINKKEKLILNNVSGYVNDAELVALIGPSGVGKSSLLEILAGRKVKGTSGKVNIDFQHLKFKGIKNDFLNDEFNNEETNFNKIAFIPQKDHHLGWLTVYETLIYASKIKNCKIAKKIIHKQMKLKSNLELYLKQKNSSKLGHLSTTNTKEQFNYFNNQSNNKISQSQINEQQQQLQFSSILQTEDEYHQTIVINILKDLSLENCMHNLVNACSGGQLRRLSIALELLNQPRLIILDEPTTGLDFSSALKTIQTLRCLTMMNKAPGILASIHQPSSLVLNQFHRVYTLGKGGQCIYDGPVDNLVDYFSSFHVNCPLYFNPADFTIQIANGDFGEQLITKLADHQIKLHETRCNELNNQHNYNKIQITTINDISSPLNFNLPAYQVSHLKLNVKHLMKRLNKKTHPTLLHTKLLLKRSWICTIREPTLTYLRLFQFVFTAFLISNLHNYKVGEIDGCFNSLNNLTQNSTTNSLNKSVLISNGEDYVQQLAKIKDNSILLFFSLMFWVMSSIIPTLLTFGNEMKVFTQERSNGWYSCFSYYVSKMLCDLPFVIICPFLFCIVFYTLTGQIMVWWRFGLFYLISLLLCLIAQSLGFIVGSVQSFPLFMIGGYLIRESVMNYMVKPLWMISYVRYSFSAIIVSIYGFGRCNTVSENAVKTTSIQTTLSNITRTDKTLLTQVRELVNEDDFNCLYDSYYTDSGYNLENYFRNCNLTLGNLFSRTLKIDLNKRLEYETKLYDGSFVLSYYEVNNESFIWNIICLIITLILLRALNYLIILHNVKKYSKN